jgi:hypothetical protein
VEDVVGLLVEVSIDTGIGSTSTKVMAGYAGCCQNDGKQAYVLTDMKSAPD